MQSSTSDESDADTPCSKNTNSYKNNIKTQIFITPTFDYVLLL